MTIVRHLNVAPSAPASLPLTRTAEINGELYALFVNRDGTPSLLRYADMTGEEIATFENPKISEALNTSLRMVAEGRVVRGFSWPDFWRAFGVEDEPDE